MARSTLVALVLASALAAPAAADSVRPPPVTAVAVMKDTGQALVWDGLRAEYVLVKSGDQLQSYFVVTVTESGVVVADQANPKVRHTLRLTPAPTTVVDPSKPRSPTAITLAPSAPTSASGLAVEDPYPADGLAPVDPYPARPAPRVVVAPTVIQGGAPEPPAADPLIPSVRAPGASAVPRTKPPTPVAPAPASPKVSVPKPAKPKAPRTETISLPRADLDAALADFSALSKEVQVERAGSGVRVVGVARGSLAHRLGLRRGDVVRSVAGEHPTSVEAAARIYARLQTVDGFDIEVERGDQRIIFRCLLK